MNLKGTLWEGVNRIDLAQDRDKLRALVGRVITFRFHKIGGNFE